LKNETFIDQNLKNQWGNYKGIKKKGLAFRAEEKKYKDKKCRKINKGNNFALGEIGVFGVFP